MTKVRYKDANRIPIVDPNYPKGTEEITMYIQKFSKDIRKDAKVFNHKKIIHSKFQRDFCSKKIIQRT